MTRVVAVDPDRPDPTILAEAAAILRSGGLVAFGTETVYGLGADATNPAAVARIFAAKGRPATNPLIVHVADVESVRPCVAVWPVAASLLAAHFWPGPLTLVLPRSALIPDLVTAGRGTVGVRVPASMVARSLIAATGRPIAAPSANRSNRISPTTAAHVCQDLEGVIDLILDSGPCSVGIESTVLNLVGETPTILRPGAVTSNEIAAIIGRSVAHFTGSVGSNQAAASPGQLAIHYAPRTPAYRLDRAALRGWDPPPGQRWGAIILGSLPKKPAPVRFEVCLHLRQPGIAATQLYEALHRLDALGLDSLIVITPHQGESGWLAVLDRVRRATQPWADRMAAAGD